MKRKFKFWMALKIVAGITFFVIAFGFGTMYLWNWLVPALFSGPAINFAQAIGLLVLAKILFGGFGRGGGWGRHGRCGSGHYGWKYRMQEKLENMTPEEKEAFKLRFKDKCRGYWNEDWEKKDSPAHE